MKAYVNQFRQMGNNAKIASRILSQLPEDTVNTTLLMMADALETNRDAILKANAEDVKEAVSHGISGPMQDRLTLTPERIAQMADGVRQVQALKTPVGVVTERIERPNGLVIEKRTVPLGVIGIIFEARPNVTVDAGALCFKTGNAVILRGGKEAFQTNKAIVDCMRHVLTEAGLPEDAIQLVEILDREAVTVLLQQREFIDVVIPRGGAGLIKRVVEDSLIPVIETGSGICHTYVDEFADLDMALSIALNAKVQRPSVCNSMETLLVHEAVSGVFLSKLEEVMKPYHVTFHGTPEVLSIMDSAVAVTDSSFATEYNDYDLNIAIVSDMEEAIRHINRYGTHHSECIVTKDTERAARFMNMVDCSTVYHNASTRFTDGFEFGFGAEIGISTQKIHARGPMGLPALTSYKYFVFGEGQIRS